MTDNHVAVCFACGWARATRSLDAARKRADDHGFDGCDTTILSEKAVAKGAAIQRGDRVAADPDELDAVRTELATSRSSLRVAEDILEEQAGE